MRDREETMTTKPAPVSGETERTMRRKALEHWRSFSQRLKYRVVVLERELSALRAEHGKAVLELARMVDKESERANAAEATLAQAKKDAEQYRQNWLAFQDLTGEQCMELALPIVQGWKDGLAQERERVKEECCQAVALSVNETDYIKRHQAEKSIRAIRALKEKP